MRRAIHIILAATLLNCSGCATARRAAEWYKDWRNPVEIEQPPAEQPEQPTTPDAPEQPPEQPEPPPVSASLMQYIPDNGHGRAVIRIRASEQPRGYSVITAHGHKSIDPPIGTHEEWMAANNGRPPHRITPDGCAEWTLAISGAEIARRALAFGMHSGAVVMIFHTRAQGGNVSHFVDARFPAGVEGGRVPVRNITNQEWRDVR
jgi:hypothetical protein